MLNRKGQGAIEYLMTYWWAILVIAIVIGALWQLGILKMPGQVQAPAAKLTAQVGEISLQDYKVANNPGGTNGTVYLVIKNGAAAKIDISNVYVDLGGGYAVNTTDTTSLGAGSTVSKIISLAEYGATKSAGDTVTMKVIVEYQAEGSTFKHNATKSDLTVVVE